MGEDRTWRIAVTEAAFRIANDRIAAWEEAEDGSVGAYLCECGDVSCREVVTVTRREYEAVRADSLRFLICDGHEQPDVETVVERHDGYAVIEKPTTVAHIVRPADPRHAGGPALPDAQRLADEIPPPPRRDA